MTQITHNLAQIKSRIVAATECYERKACSVQLLAVSKTHSSTVIAEAVEAGQLHFGENFANEAIKKQQELLDLATPPIWHFIGKIQSNKCRQIAQHFDWIHSVDRGKIARRLNRFRGAGQPLKILIQVNLSGNPDRPGIPPAEAAQLCDEIEQLESLSLCGLMGMAPLTDDFDVQSECFAKLADLNAQMSRTYPHMTELSMGMSQDLEAAISQGATWVRVGTDIFGQRKPRQ